MRLSTQKLPWKLGFSAYSNRPPSLFFAWWNIRSSGKIEILHTNFSYLSFGPIFSTTMHPFQFIQELFDASRDALSNSIFISYGPRLRYGVMRLQTQLPKSQLTISSSPKLPIFSLILTWTYIFSTFIPYRTPSPFIITNKKDRQASAFSRYGHLFTTAFLHTSNETPHFLATRYSDFNASHSIV